MTIIATGFPMDEDCIFPPVLVDPVKDEAPSDVLTEKQKNTIKKGIRDYEETLLRESDIALRPDMSAEKLEELMTIPAYERRNLKIDRT